MESKIEKIIAVSNSAIVDINYDGFQIEVNILSDFSEVECACYLYLNNKVIFKSGYKRNERHVFPTILSEGVAIKIKVFSRYKYDHNIKTSRFLPVSIKDNLRYKLSENSFDDINLMNCEIAKAKSNVIESYEKKGFKPRSDNTPYKLILPIDWLEDPFNDRNWMFQLHAWRMLDAYFVRSNVQDLRYVSKIINDWVAFEKIHKNKWLWYDMSTGLRALKICFYLKKCLDEGIDHRIEDVDYLIHEHLKHLSNPKELSPGNHALFQLHGLKSLSYILKSCGNGAYSMASIKKYANEQMSKLIISQMGKHGVHTEHSPDYHFFAHNKITNIVASPWWTDLSKDTSAILELAEYAKSWLVFPNDKCVPIGDSATGTVKKNLTALEEWPHIKSGNYIGARLDGYAVVRSLTKLPLEQSSFLFFQGSFNSFAHKHADDLSFILQENGENILIDSGKYSYQKDKYREYFLSTRAHNTIEVDGKSTTRSREYAYGSALLGLPMYVDGFWLIRAKVNHKVNEYIHERVIAYKPGKDIYVVDKLSNKSQVKSRDIRQWWHFDTYSDLKIIDNKVIVEMNQGAKIEVTSNSSSGKVNCDTYKGYESGNKLIGWASSKYLEYEPTSTLSISSTLNKETIILTRFKIDAQLSDKPDLYLKDNKIKTQHTEIANYFNI